MKGPYDLTWEAWLWLVGAGVVVAVVYTAVAVLRALREARKPPPSPPAPRRVATGEFAARVFEVSRQIATLPPWRTEPIKLTRDQIAMLRDQSTPRPGVYDGTVGMPRGVPIVEVATVEESTPYVEGWISR
ncbi:hypothetical protein AB0425_17445 [Actinosynnema sp. NPDC051121]